MEASLSPVIKYLLSPVPEHLPIKGFGILQDKFVSGHDTL